MKKLYMFRKKRETREAPITNIPSIIIIPRNIHFSYDKLGILVYPNQGELSSKRFEVLPKYLHKRKYSFNHFDGKE